MAATGMIAVFVLQRGSVWCKLPFRAASATLELPEKPDVIYALNKLKESIFTFEFGWYHEPSSHLDARLLLLQQIRIWQQRKMHTDSKTIIRSFYL